MNQKNKNRKKHVERIIKGVYNNFNRSKKTVEFSFGLPENGLIGFLTTAKEQADNKIEQLALSVYACCNSAFQISPEVQTAVKEGKTVTLNIGKALFGNVLNVTYNSKEQIIENVLFDCPTLKDLGYSISELDDVLNLVYSWNERLAKLAFSYLDSKVA